MAKIIFKTGGWLSLSPLGFLAALALLLAAPVTVQEAAAANVDFSPSSPTVEVKAGESVAVPVTVSFTNIRRPNGFVTFTLEKTVGSLDPSWLAGAGSFSLNAAAPSQHKTIMVTVPAAAASGTYQADFQISVASSSEYVYPATFSLALEVTAPACSQPPAFTMIDSAEKTVDVRNHKPGEFNFFGTVEMAEECQDRKVWYELVDEYGEFDATAPVVLTETGSFEAKIPIFQSRQGGDKDGRTYTVVFAAENEAGVARSDEYQIIVSHDSGENGRGENDLEKRGREKGKGGKH